MELKKIVAVVMIISFLLVSAVACEKEGTAEKAGKEIDRAMDSAKDKMNEMTK